MDNESSWESNSNGNHGQGVLVMPYTCPGHTNDNKPVCHTPDLLCKLRGTTIHIRSLKTTDNDVPSSLTLSLDDAEGCRASAQLNNTNAVSAWRPRLLSKQQFSGECSIDWSSVSQITITLNNLSETTASGTLLVDDLSAVTAGDYASDVAEYFYCPPLGNNIGRGELAASMLNHHSTHLQQSGTALLPLGWNSSPFPKSMIRHSHSSVQMGSRRTGNNAYANAATLLADHLLALPRSTSGVWYDVYNTALSRLIPNLPRLSGMDEYISSVHRFYSANRGHGTKAQRRASFLQLKQASFGSTTPTSTVSSRRTAPRTSLPIPNGSSKPPTSQEPRRCCKPQILCWSICGMNKKDGLRQESLHKSQPGWLGTQMLRHLGERDKARKQHLCCKMMSVATWDDQLEGTPHRGLGNPLGSTGRYAAAGGPNLGICQ